MPDVTGITALDVGIGLAFVYLLFSVLCSAVQEAIAAIFGLRARTLEEGLKTMLDDHGAASENGAPLAVRNVANGGPALSLSSSVLSHGLIRTQYRGPARWSFGKDKRGPSYIPATTFALALLDIVERDSPANNADNSPRALTERVGDAPVPAGTKDALLALANDAGGDRDELRKRIEGWFDAGMDRVSGWYKRTAQLIICGLALAVTIAFNVNTIAIADRLVRDDTLRATVVTEASKAKAEPAKTLDEALGKVDDASKLGLPLGYPGKNDGPLNALADHFLTTAGGWLITLVMLSLGAPFWFNLLGRLVALRSTGVKPKPAGGQ